MPWRRPETLPKRCSTVANITKFGTTSITKRDGVPLFESEIYSTRDLRCEEITNAASLARSFLLCLQLRYDTSRHDWLGWETKRPIHLIKCYFKFRYERKRRKAMFQHGQSYIHLIGMQGSLTSMSKMSQLFRPTFINISSVWAAISESMTCRVRQPHTTCSPELQHALSSKSLAILWSPWATVCNSEACSFVVLKLTLTEIFDSGINSNIESSSHAAAWDTILSSTSAPSCCSTCANDKLTPEVARYSMKSALTELALISADFSESNCPVEWCFIKVAWESEISSFGDSRSKLTGFASKFWTIRCWPLDHAICHAVYFTRAMLKSELFLIRNVIIDVSSLRIEWSSTIVSISSFYFQIDINHYDESSNRLIILQCSFEKSLYLWLWEFNEGKLWIKTGRSLGFILD